jgi:hypothetical protein
MKCRIEVVFQSTHPIYMLIILILFFDVNEEIRSWNFDLLTAYVAL